MQPLILDTIDTPPINSCKINVGFCNCKEYNNTLNTNNLTAKSLIDLAANCSSFDLQFFYLKNDDYLTEEKQYTIKFHENKNLFGKNLANHRNKMCHFESINESENHSSLSACSIESISGIIRINQEPFALNFEGNSFTLTAFGVGYLDSCDLIKKSFYGKNKRLKRDLLSNDFVHNLKYYERYLDGTKRYVELALVADNSIYIKYEKDAKKIHDRLHTLASNVNSLYAPLNIRITLVWADIWVNENLALIDSNVNQSLAQFLAYRKSKMLSVHSNDNAHLITNQTFGPVIGKAYKGTICSYDYSGGIIVDHAPSTALVSSTLAHEMGHNFGMDHDADYSNQCYCPTKHCIMAPASNSVNASIYFSNCSLTALQSSLKQGLDYCLLNIPKEGFGGAKCGNGIIEAGEECDCGSKTFCPNRCCIPSTCKLALDAECADGDCCNLETCKPKEMASVCRNSMNSCDLPEYCDGLNPVCPPDFYVQNGLECPNDLNSYCYDGICGSRNQQCKHLWGPTGENSVPECYTYNRNGFESGNCGYNLDTQRFLRCSENDITCGRLHCTSPNEKALFLNVYSTYSYVQLADGKQMSCRTLRTTINEKNKRDFGMVPNGAKCGDGNICINSQCRNHSSFIETVYKCNPENCNGKGICNNFGNCHCINGYGGDDCNMPGYGGSVNSGPASNKVFNAGYAFLYIFFVGLILFAIATYYFKKKKGYWLHKKIWKAFKTKFNVYSTVRVPVRRAPPIPGASIQHTHRFSWNAIWGDSSSKQGVKKEQPSDVIKANTTNFITSLPSHCSVASVKSNPFKHRVQSQITENCEPTVKFPTKSSIVWENTVKTNKDVILPSSSIWKQKQDEKLVLVNPVTRDATCTSPSTLSNENENVQESLQTNNILSKKKLINKKKDTDKQLIINQSSNNSTLFNDINTKNEISNIKLMNEIKKNIDKNLFVKKNDINEFKPPIPLHYNENRPILLKKPKLAVNSTITDAKIEVSATPINFNDEKPLNVKKLAAKFNN